MSTQSFSTPVVERNHPDPTILSRRPTYLWLRLTSWTLGIVLASIQAWSYRYQASADSISYLDVSDGVMPGGDWHRLINGIWSPLYPLLVGLVRREFGVSPQDEIVAAHLLNIGLFVLAFLCFEFFLTCLVRRMQALESVRNSPAASSVPLWAYTALAYALFLWGSIYAISLRYLRSDMLLACFFYLAAAMLLNMSQRPARWGSYLLLGVVMGVGYLAKTPMLPISALILAISLFVVENWRPAIKMAFAAFAVVLTIGAAYFVPLSRACGKFTLGESTAFNYLTYVDRAGPGRGWYLVNPGKGAGNFLHPPERIFSSPPVYAFSHESLVTHPLRFEPAKWMEGVRPRFALKRQIGETYSNFIDLWESLRRLTGLLALMVVLAWFAPRKQMASGIKRAWPILVMAVAGCAMYLAVHLEARYIGAFLVLFFCASLSGFQEISPKISLRMIAFVTVIVIATLLMPSVLQLYSHYYKYGLGKNEDAIAAVELGRLGVQPGDHVGRISRFLIDLGIERIARVEVVDEADFTHADEFWSTPVEIQHQVLQALASHGAKAVIATQPRLTDANRSDWKQLASTRYWVWTGRETAGM